VKFHLLSNARERAHESVNGPLTRGGEEHSAMPGTFCVSDLLDLLDWIMDYRKRTVDSLRLFTALYFLVFLFDFTRG